MGVAIFDLIRYVGEVLVNVCVGICEEISSYYGLCPQCISIRHITVYK